MSKTTAAKRTTSPDAAPAAVPAPAFQPHPILFRLLAVALIALLAGMLTLYFKTVYPNRYAPHTVEQDQLDKPGAPVR